MKIFKKMVALTAMAAVCFTMSAPVTASAATRAVDPGMGSPVCPPHYMSAQNKNVTTSTDTHEYIFSYEDHDGDGIFETVTKSTCTVTTVKETYCLVCSGCGMVIPGQEKTTVTHSSCGQ